MPPLSRLEHCTSELEKKQAELEAITAELPLLPQQIEDAMVTELRRWPRAAADGLGTVARRLTDKEEKLHRRRDTLTGEIAALRIVIGEEAAKAQEAAIAEAIVTATAVNDRLVAAYKEVGDAIEMVDKIYHSSIVATVLELERFRDDLSRQGVDVTSVKDLLPRVRPVPTTLWSLLHQMYGASADPGGLGRRLDEPTAYASDVERRLPALTPDLRGRQRVEFRGVETMTKEFRQ